MTTPTRRQLLQGTGATALTATFTGCLGFGSGHGGSPWYDLSLTPLETTLRESIVNTKNDRSEAQQIALREAVNGEGSATVYGWQPFENNTYVEYNETYYQTEIAESDQTKSQERYVVYLLPASERDATNAVSIQEFPERDWTPLKHALKYGHKLQEETTTPDSVSNRYVSVLHEATAENSGLVPDPDYQYVKHNDEYFEVVVEQRMVEESRVELSVSEVADSSEAFESYAQETVLRGTLSKDSLSRGALEIVETAINDEYGYDEEVPLSDAFVEVLNACGYEASSDGVDGESIWGERHYVRYQERIYRAQVTEAVA